MNGIRALKDSAETNGSPSSQEVRVIPRPFCFLCGEAGIRLYKGLVDWLLDVPGSWEMQACRTCETAWLDPQPVVEDIPKLYSRYYTHKAIPITKFDGLRTEISRNVLGRMGYPGERSGP